MIMLHIENARENEILIWAVGVKIYGNKAIKFSMKISRKFTLTKKITPLNSLFISAFISFLIAFKIKYFLFLENLNFRIIKMGRKIVNHTRLRGDVEGSKIENRFVINFRVMWLS